MRRMERKDAAKVLLTHNVRIVVDNLIIDVCWSLRMLSIVQIEFMLNRKAVSTY